MVRCIERLPWLPFSEEGEDDSPLFDDLRAILYTPPPAPQTRKNLLLTHEPTAAVVEWLVRTWSGWDKFLQAEGYRSAAVLQPLHLLQFHCKKHKYTDKEKRVIEPHRSTPDVFRGTWGGVVLWVFDESHLPLRQVATARPKCIRADSR